MNTRDRSYIRDMFVKMFLVRVVDMSTGLIDVWRAGTAKNVLNVAPALLKIKI
jgi:hypothetical protein